MIQEIDSTTREGALARMDDWKARLEALYSDLETWAGRVEGARVVRREIEHGHAFVRKFGPEFCTLPGAVVFCGDVRAGLRPYSPWVWGANGRVNIVTNRLRLMLLDLGENGLPARWTLVNPARRADHVPLDEKSFRRILRDEDPFK